MTCQWGEGRGGSVLPTELFRLSFFTLRIRRTQISFGNKTIKSATGVAEDNSHGVVRRFFRGARPSSGAASSACSNALDFSDTPLALDAAAPEEGRLR
jgi:hypothetical protein